MLPHERIDSMKITRVVLIVLMMCSIYSALSARIAAATSYIPHAVIEEQQRHTPTNKRSEGITCLFHGANPDVVHQILGQEFFVFSNPARETLLDKTPVGKVRLTAAIGAHYLEAVFIAGELKEGDVVQLRDIYALVVLTNGRCETLKQPDQ